LAEVTNELQERQHRWAQIESLCGFNIVSDIKPSTPGTSDGRERKTSNVAQAIANVANIGSVGSGRKLSDNTSPPLVAGAIAGTSMIDNDPPPTYSSVAVQNSPNLGGSRATSSTKAESLDPNSVSSKPQNDCEMALVNRLIGGSVGSNGTNHLVLLNGHNSDGLTNGNMDSFSGSKNSPPAGNKTKKRISWFGSSNKRDSWTIAEADSNGDTEEEKRRKKIKWLWRSAAIKSTAKRKEQLHSENPSIS